MGEQVVDPTDHEPKGVKGVWGNRDLSWLEFNRRVLHEALDERNPLLERVFFLAIYTSNLDEFFQKRVGGLRRQIAAGVASRTIDGKDPRQLLADIRKFVVEMNKTQADCYTQSVRPALAAAGVELLKWEELSQEERAFANDFFRANLFPVLTPLAVDPGHPFPFISNLSTSLGVMLRQPFGDGIGDDGRGERQFARVKVPRVLPRWVRLEPTSTKGKTKAMRFVNVLEMIEHNLQDLFPGMVIEQVMPFRVARNADIERDDEDAEDLLESIEQQLRDRRFANVVRLEVGEGASPEMTRFLLDELDLDDSDAYHMSSELDFTDLFTIASLRLPKLKNEPWSPVVPLRLQDDDADIFGVIRTGDVLVHHPYESFPASVERFIRAAAADPKVLAIKQTLYRTSSDSPFIPELIRAAEAGKQVVCLVELKARFDEERNIQVAQVLEKAGVHVVYGIVGLKTHTKVSLVVRHEAEGMRTYCHIGTGNYNSKTANLYTDLGLFTCNPDLTADCVELFHYLTGRSLKRDFRTLLIAPINMRRRFVEMIDREIAHCDAWKKRGGKLDDPDRPHIIAKMNSLEDLDIGAKLREASQAGVRVQLIVRGFCCLRPGVPGQTENISVLSVIGRFLEHSRIYYFHNAGKGEYYIGSADWMYRNLNNRVECITPIYSPVHQQRLRQILNISLGDYRQAWEMQPDGGYVQRKPDQAPADALPEAKLGTHRVLMDLARREALAAKGE
ncbi:MAG: polyphosphate kinase 1 [Phycisphaera sp.]|nr:polyphosphate kinase 1 [Phycisphaera sp.]